MPEALRQAGPPEGRIVVDTTNQFGPGPKPAAGLTAAAFNVGSTAGCAVMEAPRREGAVYGEAYRPAEAREVLAALRDGRAIGPAPRYPEH